MKEKSEKKVVENEQTLTLESLNENLEAFKAEVMKRLPMQPLAPVHSVNPVVNPLDVSIPEEQAKSEISFILHDRFADVRVFNEENNGKEWRDLANQFHRVNERQIKKRKDI